MKPGTIGFLIGFLLGKPVSNACLHIVYLSIIAVLLSLMASFWMVEKLCIMSSHY